MQMSRLTRCSDAEIEIHLWSTQGGARSGLHQNALCDHYSVKGYHHETALVGNVLCDQLLEPMGPYKKVLPSPAPQSQWWMTLCHNCVQCRYCTLLKIANRSPLCPGILKPRTNLFPELMDAFSLYFLPLLFYFQWQYGIFVDISMHTSN